MSGPYASFEFQAPCERISLNGRTGRAHWAVKAKLTSTWRHAVEIHARNAKLRDLPPCVVQFTFYVGTHRNRDHGNLAPTTKAAVDGMKDAGCWPDDTTDWVLGVKDSFEVDKQRAGLVRVDCWLMAPREAA